MTAARLSDAFSEPSASAPLLRPRDGNSSMQSSGCEVKLMQPTTGVSPGKNSMRFAWPVLSVVGVTAALIAVTLTRGAQPYHSGVYLFGDHGVTMLAAEEIAAGRMLYRLLSAAHPET